LGNSTLRIQLLSKWGLTDIGEILIGRVQMSHEYFDVDLAIVWDTVHSPVPELETQRQTTLSQIES
jgi:uncharacterized protein with HEPN domain